eukprot:CAMPEP_0183291060 /NCGR_PEP_ID=MMETSP0160_2-20130417/618_1 /TAXON_ID=2839 ORGANISM="Odontella Sinensis, Strain Grunow 1884" /NCGR_SAMPLE_ID=MMETSP0160_2 /ASSEMBLY_ACC=CAM_ASM_000250 /LENGTH=378 /DNA_ID=CAMNT_0025451813 /DNA_START=57 /DNA_END=1193 /DNA_ORIENTATION=-
MAVTRSAPFAALAAVLLLSSGGGADAFAPSKASSFALRRGSSLSMSAALIVQNKGGGHGELGYQLAKNLQSNPKITSVTILQDDACKDAQEPFASYATDLPDVKVVKVPLGDESTDASAIQSALGDDATFEYVWDNASKGPVGAGKAVCDLAKGWNVKLLTYVSSAGMYQPAPETVFPMSETTPIKESAGQAQYDNYAVELGLPLVSFRPQYIYGPKANKYDYVDWYLDRICRNAPLPIPGDGTQKVSLTHSADVASLLASVLNDEDAAVEQRYFNCGTDDLISYDEVAMLCAEAAGVDRSDVDVAHYDAEALGKGKFPFRPSDFYVAPDVAKEKLGWEGPGHNLKEDLGWYFEGYVARGGKEREVDLSKDPVISAEA